MIVERAGFVIRLSSDSPVAQGDNEWLENHSMYLCMMKYYGGHEPSEHFVQFH